MIMRVFERRLRDLMEVFPVVAVTGCRQVGKTTLVRRSEILQGRRYITPADLSARELARSDPPPFSADAGRVVRDGGDDGDRGAAADLRARRSPGLAAHA